MSEKFSFFDSVLTNEGEYDREYNAQEFTDYFKSLVTTGLMKGLDKELKVTANGSNMMVEIDTGVAFLQGRYYRNDAKLAHTHDTESLGKNRIDRIVIRLDLNTEARYVKSFVKKGVASTSPVAPALTRNNLIYEISLAQVKIIGGQTYIKATDVTDERGNQNLCPYAGSNILPNFNDEELESLINTVNALDSEAIRKAEKGKANGVASLGSDGTVPVNLLRSATTSRSGIVQLNDSITSTTSLQAATPLAVKLVNDKLVSEKVQIGEGAEARYKGNIAIGRSVATNHHCIAIGSSNSKGEMSIAVGGATVAEGEKSIAIGGGSKAYEGEEGVAIGYIAIASRRATALGRGAWAYGRESAAIGYGANTNNSYEGVLGSKSSNDGPYRWIVPGNFSVQGSKNFEIPHPAPHKKATHVIRHGAVESPTPGDTLYRYTIKATEDGQTIEHPLPDYFEHLNTNVDVWVNAHKHFAHAFGEVQGDILKVTCEKSGEYKVLVIGTRNDDNVQEWYVKGVEREIGESWLGETYVFDVDEIIETEEVKEEIE